MLAMLINEVGVVYYGAQFILINAVEKVWICGFFLFFINYILRLLLQVALLLYIWFQGLNAVETSLDLWIFLKKFINYILRLLLQI